MSVSLPLPLLIRLRVGRYFCLCCADGHFATASLVTGWSYVPLISQEVQIYLRDTHDHCVQTSEVVEMYREMASGLMNTYLSAVANRTNEVMKVLTIVSTIFIPLTFIAGVYGMNFEYMPELHVRWAYPLIWLTMLGTAGLMALFFVKKGWLGGGSSYHDDE